MNNQQTVDALTKDNQLFLAPMSGITDKSFRLLMHELGADIVISELLSAESITTQHAKTMSMLKVLDSERPVGIQLFGGDPEKMNQAAKIAIDCGADFIDINLGCPMPKVVKKRSGSALLQDPIYLEEFLSKINQGFDHPMTVKIRTGWNETTRNAEANILAAKNAGTKMVSVHGRTREQGYEGKADWEYIKKLSQESVLPIIGNGDITNAPFAANLLKNQYSKSLMIGRGCLINPFIFIEIRQLLGQEIQKPRLIDIIERYIEITEDNVEYHFRNIKRAKIFHWFSLPFSDTEIFKNNIFALKHDSKGLLQFTRNYFANKQDVPPSHFNHEGFLMGGHG
jgi:tRNA-dihydrouridine synthase B